ncbi:MAG: aryl-sulfate sulfotransferase, partial [Myxococcota bacterium]
RPVTPVVRWTDGEVERSLALPEGTSWTGQALLGFRPARTYELTVEMEGEPLTSAEVEVPALPEADMPDLHVVASDPERMQPGFTLVPYWGSTGRLADAVVALDPTGEVVYFQRVDQHVLDARTIDGGLQLLLGGGPDSVDIREVDWLGNTLRAFRAASSTAQGIPVDIPDKFTHDVVSTPDGGFVALSNRAESVDGYPVDYDDPGPTQSAEITADAVVAFDATGAVSWELPLTEVLDPTRVGFDGLANGNSGAYSWGHSNSLWVEDDGRIGVSVRNQDVVVLLDPVARAVDWMLGTPANWDEPWREVLLTPTGPLEWPSHQHAAHRDADGLITMFDNGNYRASPGEVPFDDLPPPTERYSRVVRYAVDEAEGTVTQVAAFDLSGSAGPVYSEALGDADLLPNGDVLGVYGRIVSDGGKLNRELGYAEFSVRIVEWDPQGREVFHLHLTTDPAAYPEGWNTYRAERFADFR